jgi:hypothetical protein
VSKCPKPPIVVVEKTSGIIIIGNGNRFLDSNYEFRHRNGVPEEAFVHKPKNLTKENTEGVTHFIFAQYNPKTESTETIGPIQPIHELPIKLLTDTKLMAVVVSLRHAAAA